MPSIFFEVVVNKASTSCEVCSVGLSMSSEWSNSRVLVASDAGESMVVEFEVSLLWMVELLSKV